MITKPIIILIVLLSTAYRIVLGIVEMRSANNPTPANLADVYDAETYANWKRYSREKSRLSLIFICISAVLSLVLLVTNAYAWAASIFPGDWFNQLFSVILLDLLVNLIPGIVRSYLFNMVIEQKYGFNRTTMKTFIFDQIRSNSLELFLSLALAMLLLMGVLVWIAVREPLLHTAFGFTEVNYGFAYILVGCVLGLIQPLTGMIMNARSRAAEYKADAQAVKEGYGPAMITALKKLARENFAHLAPSRLDVLMDYSHPPLTERIAAVEKQLEKQ